MSGITPQEGGKKTIHPNIIIMYADDLGFGDIECYGGTSIPTPHLNRLASEGLRFTNGYATAATCTPSRYSLLTGSYPWRNKYAAILAGDAPMIISPDMPTLPAVLKQAGYTTAIVGKWHLGLGRGNLDWNEEIPLTPLDVGFDRSFIMAATNDRVPCVYIDGRRVVGLDPTDPIEVSYINPFPGIPTGRDNPELLRIKPSHGHDMSIVNGIGRIGYMRGGRAALWRDEEMAEVFLNKAISFITENKNRPFFLYYAFHQPHVPRIPGTRFVGATGLGPRGDVIAEMDWCVGEIIDTLDRLGIRDNTIVIFSSDNGPVLDDGYEDQAAELCLLNNHRPAGPLRGGKYSMYDGGTRVPFILSWPAEVKPGVSSALVSHVDFLASFASLVNIPLPPEAGPDSLNVMSAFLGQDNQGRDELVTEGTQAKTVLRRGDWVFIPPHDGPPINALVGIETGNSPAPQLYNLSVDIGQIRNLATEYEAIVREMSGRLREILEG